MSQEEVDVPARVAAGGTEGDVLTFSGTRMAYSVSGAVFDRAGGPRGCDINPFRQRQGRNRGHYPFGIRWRLWKIRPEGTYLVVCFQRRLVVLLPANAP